MNWSRRRVLSAGGALAGAAAAGLRAVTARGQEPAARHDVPAARRIALLNLHTDERLEIEYFREGAYLPEALLAITPANSLQNQKNPDSQNRKRVSILLRYQNINKVSIRKHVLF